MFSLQTFEFAKALSGGQREAWRNIKPGAENKVREVIIRNLSDCRWQ